MIFNIFINWIWLSLLFIDFVFSYIGLKHFIYLLAHKSDPERWIMQFPRAHERLSGLSGCGPAPDTRLQPDKATQGFTGKEATSISKYKHTKQKCFKAIFEHIGVNLNRNP